VGASGCEAYDGLCINAKRAEQLLGQVVDRVHFDEAWCVAWRGVAPGVPPTTDCPMHGACLW
jgi:hypothetical protein